MNVLMKTVIMFKHYLEHLTLSSAGARSRDADVT